MGTGEGPLDRFGGFRMGLKGVDKGVSQPWPSIGVMDGSKEGSSWVIRVVGVVGGHGEGAGMVVGGVWRAEGLKEGGLEGMGCGVLVFLEQGSYILLKGTCTVFSPGVRLVLFGGGVEVMHVLQVGGREVAQASTPGVITVSLVRVCSCVCGGAGGAKLDEVTAWGQDIKVGVMIISVDVDVGVDQMVCLGVKGPCEVVLALLGLGI